MGGNNVKKDDCKDKLKQLLAMIRLKKSVGQDYKEESDEFFKMTASEEQLQSLVVSMPQKDDGEENSLSDIIRYVLQNLDKKPPVTSMGHLSVSQGGGEIVDVNNNGLIRQSNELVEANYKLSVAEQKVILNVCTQIDPTKDHFEVVRVSAKSLSRACGFSQENGYRQLQHIAKKLLSRVIILKKRDSQDWYGTHWVQGCDYVSGKDGTESYITFELDPRLCPQFLQLKERFLKMNISNIVSFSHVYSTRFYMIFLNRLKIGHMKLSFERIRSLLVLGNNYTVKNMKARVIKPAIEEINQVSSLEVTYNYYTEGGRKQVGTEFFFHTKKGSKPLKEIKSSQEKIKNDLTGEDARVYSRLVSIGKMDADVAEDLIKNYGAERCRRNFEAQRQKGTAKNLAGLTVKAIKEDWEGKRQAQAKQIAAEEAELYKKQYEAAEPVASDVVGDSHRKMDSDILNMAEKIRKKIRAKNTTKEP